MKFLILTATLFQTVFAQPEIWLIGNLKNETLIEMWNDAKPKLADEFMFAQSDEIKEDHFSIVSMNSQIPSSGGDIEFNFESKTEFIVEVFQYMNSYESITQLDDSNFDHQVIEDKTMWLIFFYNLQGNKSKRYLPVFEQAAKEFAGTGKVKFGLVDTEPWESKYMTAIHQVWNTPTVYFYAKGPKSYKMAQKVSKIFQLGTMIENKLEASDKTKLHQITREESFFNICDGPKNTLCVITFVQKNQTDEQRLQQFDGIFNVMEIRSKPFVYLWTVLGDHPEIETVFGIQENTPTTLALSPHEMVKVTLENVITESELLAFLDSDDPIDDKFDHTKIRFRDVKAWKPASAKK